MRKRMLWVILLGGMCCAATLALAQDAKGEARSPLQVVAWNGHRAAVTWTFDDGLPSQVAHYAEIHKTGVRASYYLNASSPYDARWREVAADGNEIGNHGAHHCHADGSGCNGPYLGSVAAELTAGTLYLQKTYGIEHVWSTVAPYGDMGYVKPAAEQFFLNRGVWGGQIAPGDQTDPFNLLVHAATAGEKEAAFDAQIDAARAGGHWLIFLIHSLGGDGGYAPIEVADLLGSMHHASQTGDVWIDTMTNVGAYWLGQKALEQAQIRHEDGRTILQWTLPAHFPPGHTVLVTVAHGQLQQQGRTLQADAAGRYSVALDDGAVTIVR